MPRKIDHKYLAELYGSDEVATTILTEIDEGPPVQIETLFTEGGRTARKTELISRRECLERGLTVLPTRHDAIVHHIKVTKSEYPTKEEHDAHAALLAGV